MQVSVRKFGTAPVFLTAISTILGAILFLRFGVAVGEVGLMGTIAIVLIGHLVTIPTAMALAEIATNQKVEGGGEYFIISRSFGLTIGASIGIALYLSQAISVAFYVIAFSEAFTPVINSVLNTYDLTPQWGTLAKTVIGLITVSLLGVLMLRKGANLGMNLLYIVVSILALALIFFFLGGNSTGETNLFASNRGFRNSDRFFQVFAICFPAFTGMTAGVGLSGDLKDPKKSIPLGTLAATISGMIIYIIIAVKLASSANATMLLDTENLVMGEISIWAPMILIGLGAATLSSALGSVMVAPRTLQAIAADRIIPNKRFNYIFSRGRGKSNEPVNASMLTFVIAALIILIGGVDVVAKIISMFFMVTYGSICLISFFENFAANPGYRPAFKSRWYFSLLGVVMCLYLMFKMNTGYAMVAIILMVIIYYLLSRSQEDEGGLASIFKGVIFQMSRRLHIFLQKAQKDDNEDNWRPSVISITKNSFERYSAFDMIRWISHKYGFGTYIHHIDGYLSKETHEEAQETLKRLIKMAQVSKSSVFVDTVVSPSYTASIAQTLQLPGVSGKENNMVLFEFSKDKPEELTELVDNFNLIKAVNFDVCILGSSEKNYGYHSEIHIYITSNDYANANLMIILGYILLGHPEWKNAVIKLFAIYPKEQLEEQRSKLQNLVKSGRLPISYNNIRVLTHDSQTSSKDIINETSVDADLTIVGFRADVLRAMGSDLFKGYDKIGNVLFVNTLLEKEIN